MDPVASMSQSAEPCPCWKMKSVLVGERLVDRLRLQLLRNEEGDQVRDHDRYDDRVVSRQLEHHDHRRQGSPDDSGESHTHANERVSAGSGSRCGEQHVRQRSDRRTHHCPDEKAWAKKSAGVSGCVSDGSRDNLEHREKRDDFQQRIAVEPQVIGDHRGGAAAAQQHHHDHDDQHRVVAGWRRRGTHLIVHFFSSW